MSQKDAAITYLCIKGWSLRISMNIVDAAGRDLAQNGMVLMMPRKHPLMKPSRPVSFLELAIKELDGTDDSDHRSSKMRTDLQEYCPSF